MPTPLTAQIGGPWNNIASVDSDRSYLMGFVWLNEDYEPVSEPSILKIIGGLPLKFSRAL
jgi:hypothetical protein